MNEGRCDLENTFNQLYDNRVNVIHTMTPEPKYFAKLKVSLARLLSDKQKTHSYTAFGTLSHDECLARTGNKAPVVEPARMIKMDPTRRPK